MSSPIRVSMCANQNQTLKSVAVLPSCPSSWWAALESICKAKLRFTFKRLFLDSGAELNPGNIRDLVNGCTLVASKGEDYVGAPPGSRSSVVQVVGHPGASVCKSPQVHVLVREAWLEDGAVTQLRQVVRDLPCVRMAFGMPDLHPGKRYPIGAVFGAEDVIYPALVGGDIGCGMCLSATDIKAERASERAVARWVKQLDNLEGGTPEDVSAEHDAALEQLLAAEAVGIDAATLRKSMGTIGGGNHFAELQCVDHVFVDGLVDASVLHLLVHSGSRGLGGAILDKHLAQFGDAGLHASSPQACAYLALHDAACAWARRNRRRIAARFAAALEASIGGPLLDIWHNNVAAYSLPPHDPAEAESACEGLAEARGSLWLHRKGAAPSDEGLVVIPGSRGTYSYLVEPLQPTVRSGFSLAHGAGRKWARSKAFACVASKYPNPATLRTTALAGQVVCDDKRLLYEEAPEAYKDIESVVNDLVAEGLVRKIARLRPLITYKTQS